MRGNSQNKLQTSNKSNTKRILAKLILSAQKNSKKKENGSQRTVPF
jgi:hypothetical protein